MGLYIYVSNQDRTEKRKVSDETINTEFQEVLKHDPSLMIEEHTNIVRKGFLKRRAEVKTYSVYHETPALDGSPYQARLQMSGSGEKKVVIAYLHGIINGCTCRVTVNS